MKRALLFTLLAWCLLAPGALAGHMETFDPGKLKPTDSTLKVKVGDPAPDFTLREIKGGTVSLHDYLGKKNVVLSFVPAAWTPVCSDQWPGYNLALDMIHDLGAEVIGISEDNTPSQAMWVKAMHGLNFPVLSDFWPHGKAAGALGVLRSDGTAERAIFIIDRQGIIRYIDVHDINSRPDLGGIVNELEKLAE
ncbi:alkyl hydroperoxide reductase/ Thiol specific antioxidant/ Mal allergen [Pseudodesulfovibrio mercurii]|uniref:Alkyl hydroperoxide reductase/ Thiol specific antioxidant/ Mal allergen n=1 Tax=Pseudodesulfovibrio mercurii TaxID=641491 RepID=F0JK03_9BACT|nr:peroxiredoxin [Pseudodesulfovibrio mercurii]EGB16252.1 alkyl hydroperoxide reductase/ Thiol specific antioxidant/ Mal allergen [Pseudodesulfovibrio mercurii]